MSRAMEEMEGMTRFEITKRLYKIISWIDDELIPFLEDRQDCEQDQSGYHPNEEMKLLSDLEAILGRSGRPW